MDAVNFWQFLWVGNRKLETGRLTD